MIWPSINLNPTGGECELLNEGLNTLRLKDKAWKFKGKAIKLLIPRVTKRSRANQSFHGVPKDWAWKFKRKVCLKATAKVDLQ